jgi:hypothetical protein
LARPLVPVDGKNRHVEKAVGPPLLLNHFTAARRQSSIDTSTTMKIWCDLKLSATSTWPLRRHFCINCRDF